MGQLSTRNVPNAPPAVKLGHAGPGQKVHMQVVNAGVTIYWGADRDVVESAPPFLPHGGYPLDSTSGLIEIQMSGDIWATGDPTNASIPQVRFGVD